MRRFFLLLIAATTTTVWLGAQGGPTLTFTGAPSTPVELERSADGKTFTPAPLGSTSGAGALTLTPTQLSLLSGKPMIDIRYAQCPKGNRIDLFPGGPASTTTEDQCPPGCSCHRDKGAFAWGSNFTGQAPFPGPGPAAGQSFFFNNPWSWAVVGGGVAGGVLIAKGGGSATPSGPETRTETAVVNHTFGGEFTAGGNACGFTSSGGTVAFSGTMASTAGIFTESSGTLISNSSGAVTQGATGNMNFIYMGSAAGAIQGLGTYNSTAQITFDTGNGVTGTLVLNFLCGTVTLTISASSTAAMIP